MYKNLLSIVLKNHKSAEETIVKDLINSYMNRKYDIFISYSRKDYAITEKITHALNAGGFSYFIDQQGLASGEGFVQAIINAINNSRLFLCVLSQNAYSSDFLIKELRYALYENIIVFPVIVDNSPLPNGLKYLLGDLHITNWQFYGSVNIEDIIISDISRALGRFEDNLSNKEKKQNAISAKKRQGGSDDYIPHLIDVDIFISYRRVDGRDYARNIMQALKISGFPKVFFDYNSLRDGVFNTQILDAIYSCNDFILVISPLALKNCSRESDWVAKEIRMALKYGKKIVPVVIEDTFTGWPSDFPKDLSIIKDIHFHKLMTDEYFEDSIVKLTKRLATTVSTDQDNSIGLQDLQTPESNNKQTYIYKI